MAAHTSQFGAGTHIQDYPGCPAEGQILQRGQVWNMPVFSLMTHSTINTPQLSGSARVYGRVYWMLALVPRRTLSRPSWSSSRLELEALQSDTCTVQWRPAATHTQMEADTHSSTEEPMRRQEKSDSSAIFIFTWEKSFVSLSFFTSSPNKVFFFFDAQNTKVWSSKSYAGCYHFFPHGLTYSGAPLDAPGVTAGSCPAPAEWSTVQRLEMYPKDDPLVTQSHIRCLYHPRLTSHMLRNIMQLTHFSHKSSIFSISADRAVNWAWLPSERMLYTPHSKSHKPREFKSFCPLLTFGLTLRSLARKKKTAGRTVAAVSGERVWGEKKKTPAHTPHLSSKISLPSNDDKNSPTPRTPRLIMQLGSLLSSHVLNVQTPQCARPREAGAPRRSQILDPPSPSNNTRRGERHRLPRATAIYQKNVLWLCLALLV